MRDLTDAQWGIWLKLLCLANQQSQRGLIVIENSHKSAISTLASLLHTRRDSLATNLQLFSDKNMVDYELEGKEGWVSITNWDKRQFASDDVTARVLKHKQGKRLHKRYRTEQNIAESSPNDLCSGSVSSYSIDQGDQPATTPVEATPPESPSTEKDADNEEKRKVEWATDEILSLAGDLSTKHGYSEAMEDVRELLRNGADSKALYFSLWHTLNCYEPKGSISPRMYFRQELKERLGSLNAVAGGAGWGKNKAF